jgi:hypothetical protein
MSSKRKSKTSKVYKISKVSPESYLQAQFVKTIEPYVSFSKVPLKIFPIEFRSQESKAV